MTWLRFTSILAMALLAAGCVTKGTYDRDLAQCNAETERIRIEAETQKEYCEGEHKRWREAIEDARSFSKAEFEGVEEKFRQIEVLLPPLVQEEVGDKLGDSFDSIRLLMHNRFDLMDQQLAGLRRDVKKAGDLQEETNDRLEEANGRLEDLQTQIQQQAVAADLEKLRLRKLATQYGNLIASIQEYDRTRLNCKSCDENLGLKKKKHDDIVNFHATLIKYISDLQTRLLPEPEQAAAEAAPGS